MVVDGIKLMDAVAESWRNRVSEHQIHAEADAGWGNRTRLARPKSQARKEAGKKYNIFPCSADHEHYCWKPCPVDQ